MSLEKAIYYRKEKRKPYPEHDIRNVDWSCRNHGACAYCACNRQIRNRRLKAKADSLMKEAKELK